MSHPENNRPPIEAAIITPKAIQHTPDGSRIEVEVKATSEHAARTAIELTGGTIEDNKPKTRKGGSSHYMPGSKWTALWEPTGPAGKARQNPQGN